MEFKEIITYKNKIEPMSSEWMKNLFGMWWFYFLLGLSWLKSFSLYTINPGIQQSSALAPTFFLINIIDLLLATNNLINNFQTTKLSIPVHCRDIITAWSDKNLGKFNISRIQLCCLSNKRHYLIIMNSQSLNQEDSFRFNYQSCNII